MVAVVGTCGSSSVLAMPCMAAHPKHMSAYAQVMARALVMQEELKRFDDIEHAEAQLHQLQQAHAVASVHAHSSRLAYALDLQLAAAQKQRSVDELNKAQVCCRWDSISPLSLAFLPVWISQLPAASRKGLSYVYGTELCRLWTLWTSGRWRKHHADGLQACQQPDMRRLCTAGGPHAQFG